MESIWKRIAKMFGYVMLIVAWIGCTIPVFVYVFGCVISWFWRENVIENGINIGKAIAMMPAVGILGGFAGIKAFWEGLPRLMKTEDSV